MVQAILVRPVAGGGDGYEIIAGERRWRAAQRAGLHEVPVVVHDVSDREALELAIIENVQRADLNPLEEAIGYQQLIDEHGYSQGELGEVIGKSRPHIANTLRLLKLPEPVQAYVRSGQLSAGHARALVTLDDPEAAARRIVEAGMSVRDAEAIGSTARRQGREARAGDQERRHAGAGEGARRRARARRRDQVRRRGAATSASATGPWSSSTTSAGGCAAEGGSLR